jgi:hypothetical protein
MAARKSLSMQAHRVGNWFPWGPGVDSNSRNALNDFLSIQRLHCQNARGPHTVSKMVVIQAPREEYRERSPAPQRAQGSLVV